MTGVQTCALPIYVTEVRTDFEAGIGLGKFNDIQVGDEIETTEMVEKPRG